MRVAIQGSRHTHCLVRCPMWHLSPQERLGYCFIIHVSWAIELSPHSDIPYHVQDTFMQDETWVDADNFYTFFYKLGFGGVSCTQ